MLQVKRVLQGSASNLARVFMSALVGLVLPPLFVSHMPPVEYSAWVLILQLSAYVNLLDLGLQTAIAKFIAEYEALEDRATCARVLSTSFVLLCVAALIGIGLTLFLCVEVPQLFHQMPTPLMAPVRASLLCVGISVSVSLPFGSFLAVFVGLQRYGFPTALQTVSKIATSAALAIALLVHPHLLQLAVLITVFNIGTAFAQWVGWRAYAERETGFSLSLFDRNVARRLVKYCSVLSIWTIAGLLINGLDTVIVGHYDYANTAYYAIATSATNFMLLIVGSLFGPLVPAVSSLQAGDNAARIGQITIRATRYCALTLLLIGLPLLFGAYPLLSMWVGHTYAVRGALFLEVLVLGNLIRQLGYPYALVVVATGRQHLATIAGVAEATVNIILSIWLAQKIGAVGVAVGTVVGGLVSIGVHLTVSMYQTRSAIFFKRSRFIGQGILRPFVVILPSLALYPAWQKWSLLPASPAVLIAWAVLTVLLGWMVGLSGDDRQKAKFLVSKLVYWSSARSS